MIAFLNTFLSYLLLMVIILVVGGVALTIGINMRKNKNAKNPQPVESEVGDVLE